MSGGNMRPPDKAFRIQGISRMTSNARPPLAGSLLPLVSIIIPTYNYGRYLAKALQSCLEQTYGNLEIIVVDDGSVDDTGEIVRPFGDRVVYLFQENQGVSSARNAGLARASGEFIAFLDADDYLLADSIAVRAHVLMGNPEIGIVFTDTYSCDEKGNVYYDGRKRKDRASDRFYEDLLLRHLRFQTSAAMMRANLAYRFAFPTHLSNGEDIVYFSKVFFASRGYFVAKPTVVNLHHGDSLRHDVDEVVRQGTALVTAIVDDPFYHGALEYVRKELTAKRHLELFRRLYRSGEGALAREHYLKALSLTPRTALNLTFLSKAVRSFFLRKETTRP